MLTYSVVRRTVVGPWGWAREGNEKDMLGLGEAKQGSENWGRSAGAIINLRASLMVQMVKNLPAVQEWKWKCWSLSRVWLFATSWTVAHQAPLSMGFFRQEYWSELFLVVVHWPADLTSWLFPPTMSTITLWRPLSDSILTKSCTHLPPELWSGPL